MKPDAKKTRISLYTPRLQIRPRDLSTVGLAQQRRLAGAVLARLAAGHGARLGDLADVAGALPQRGQQALGGLGRQVLVVVVVDLHHGRVDAGAEALDLDEGEEPVRGRVARLDAQALLDRLDDGVGAAAAELAGCLCVFESRSALVLFAPPANSLCL